MRKKLFTLLLAVAASVGTMFAWDYVHVQIGDLYYNLDATNHTAEVTFRSCIINKYTDHTEYRYNEGWGITTANIPASVTYNSVSYSVTSIGVAAFDGCSGLTSVTIGNSVTSIGSGAFSGCSGLTSVYISDVAAWCAISFGTDHANPLYYGHNLYVNEELVTDLVIPNSVTSIGKYAFEDCTGLTSVTIPNSVTSIGEWAFSGCTGLTSMTIPNSVTSIGSGAFSGCSSLTSINVASDNSNYCSVDGVLFNKDKTTLIQYPGGKQGAYTISNSVTSIGVAAFDGCSGLTSVTIGNSVTSIGDNAFSGCSGLTSVTIPESVTSIGWSAFFNCWSLTSVYVPCGELERFRQMLNYDLSSKVKYEPLPYNLTISAENGSVTYPITICDDMELSTSPDYGYHFTQWSDGNKENPRTIVLTQDTSFTAEFAINNYIIETQSSLPEGGIISGGGTYEYLSQQTVTAIPNYGYHLVKWVIDDTPENAISVAQAYAIASALGAGETTTMQYTIVGYVTGTYGTYYNSYYLSDSPNVPGNFIAFKCASSVNIGEYVNVTGYITNYRGNTPETTSGSTIVPNLSSSLVNPYTFTLKKNISFVAEFAKNMYTITKNAEHGSISGNISAEYLDEVTLTANPDYGYHFTQWSDGNKENPRTIVLTQDTTFTAEFAKNSYAISTISANPEWGTTAGDTTALYLDEVEISAIPNYGYHFVQWDDNNTLNPSSFTLTQDTTFTATFAKNAYTITLNNAEHGSISGGTSAEYLDEVTLTANPDYGYHFTQWSDGVKDNPRTIVLTQDTTFKAEFAIDKTGNCGDDNALIWTYDAETKTLTITGNGTLNSNYYFGIEAPAQMQKLVIGNEVTSIGDSAFYGMSTINHLIIGGSVATIGNYAFAECRNFDDITCYATTVPVINETTFANVGNKQYIYLFVPEERERAYHRDTYWGEFDIQIKEAETTTTDGDVVVVPTDNTAEISWPTVADADIYEIEITKDGVVVCVLKFNTNGQLVGIAFAPGRNGANYTQQAQTTGFKFTVTGLTSGTRYGYTVAAKDALEQTVDAKSGTFTTTIEGVTTDIDQVIVPNSDQITNDPLQTTTKLLRNGQIFILRGDHSYTTDGRLVR